MNNKLILQQIGISFIATLLFFSPSISFATPDSQGKAISITCQMADEYFKILSLEERPPKEKRIKLRSNFRTLCSKAKALGDFPQAYKRDFNEFCKAVDSFLTNPPSDDRKYGRKMAEISQEKLTPLQIDFQITESKALENGSDKDTAERLGANLVLNKQMLRLRFEAPSELPEEVRPQAKIFSNYIMIFYSFIEPEERPIIAQAALLSMNRTVNALSSEKYGKEFRGIHSTFLTLSDLLTKGKDTETYLSLAFIQLNKLQEILQFTGEEIQKVGGENVIKIIKMLEIPLKD